MSLSYDKIVRGIAQCNISFLTSGYLLKIQTYTASNLTSKNINTIRCLLLAEGICDNTKSKQDVTIVTLLFPMSKGKRFVFFKLSWQNILEINK